MENDAELERIRTEYSRRAADSNLTNIYSVLNPASLMAIHSRESALFELLRRQRISDLVGHRLLDVGCGNGIELLRWIGYGMAPENCSGIDLLSDRIEHARHILPGGVNLLQGSADNLPFTSSSFSIITQYTVFSSLLDLDMKMRIAAEMLRVLQPRGIVIWYDFWINPTNRHTKGIHVKEIRNLFPDCSIDARLVTLAPPIARKIAPISKEFARVLEYSPLRTHWLAIIRKL